MQKITIYTTTLCPYCIMAKRLLKQKGAIYEEIDVAMSDQKRSEMRARSGGCHTVPQIFIADQHVGGCDELYALDKEGKLDPLLQD